MHGLRYALPVLPKQPAFTAIAAITLAFGLSAGLYGVFSVNQRTQEFESEWRWAQTTR